MLYRSRGDLPVQAELLVRQVELELNLKSSDGEGIEPFFGLQRGMAGAQLGMHRLHQRRMDLRRRKWMRFVHAVFISSWFAATAGPYVTLKRLTSKDLDVPLGVGSVPVHG